MWPLSTKRTDKALTIIQQSRSLTAFIYTEPDPSGLETIGKLISKCLSRLYIILGISHPFTITCRVNLNCELNSFRRFMRQFPFYHRMLSNKDQTVRWKQPECHSMDRHDQPVFPVPINHLSLLPRLRPCRLQKR